MTRLGERWEWYLFAFEGWPKKDVEKAVCLIWLPAHTKPILAASAAWHSIEDKSHTSKQTMLFLSTLKLINTKLCGRCQKTNVSYSLHWAIFLAYKKYYYNICISIYLSILIIQDCNAYNIWRCKNYLCFSGNEFWTSHGIKKSFYLQTFCSNLWKDLWNGAERRWNANILCIPYKLATTEALHHLHLWNISTQFAIFIFY